MKCKGVWHKVANVVLSVLFLLIQNSVEIHYIRLAPRYLLETMEYYKL